MNPCGRAALIALLLASPALAGDAEKKKELNTDRPDFTESSITVPAGRLQLESGLTYSDESDGSRFLSGPEALFRYGVGRRTELRFIAPNYGRQWSPGASGWSDAAVGLKQQLGPVGRFDVAIIAHATLPTEGAFSSGRVDPQASLTWSADLAEKWSVAGQFAFSAPTEAGGRNFTFAPTVSLVRELTGRLSTFLEWAAWFPEAGGDIHVLHSGLAYALTEQQQLDLHYGFGLSRAAPDFFIGAGYVVRF